MTTKGSVVVRTRGDRKPDRSIEADLQTGHPKQPMVEKLSGICSRFKSCLPLERITLNEALVMRPQSIRSVCVTYYPNSQCLTHKKGDNMSQQQYKPDQ